MNICGSRLVGMILSLVVCFFPTTILCQDVKWTGHHYQYHPSTTLWPVPSHGNYVAANQDLESLEAQSSIRRQASYTPINWQNPHSKPQWQTAMYKVKWQDPFSKPQWQVSKAHHIKPFSKQPFKNINGLSRKWQDGGWSSPKQWRGTSRNKFLTTSVMKSTPAARNVSPGTWPDYIPPLSVFKPSMDDPHALLNTGK